MMKAKSLIGALVGGAVALAALLGACEHPSSPSEPAATGKVAVTLALAGISGPSSAVRTVFPDVSGIDKYALAFTATSGGKDQPEVVVNAPASTVNVELVVGTYTLTVTARKGGVDIAEGTTTGLAISKGQTATEEVTLKPKTGTDVAKGTFSYDVTLPTGATGTLTINTAIDGGTVVGTATLTAGNKKDTLNLDPGQYWLKVALTNKDGMKANFGPEVVYSYSTLDSAFEKEFTESYFEETPKGSLGTLTITFAGQDTIPLSDTAVSFEQGAADTFTLSVTDGDFKEIAWYLDGTAVAGTSYTPPNNLSVKKHLVTVTAVKNGNTYSEFVEFTVTAAAAAVPDGYIAKDSAVTLALIGTNAEYPLDGQYYQTENFEITGAWTPIGPENEDGKRFTGEYDGNGKVITPNNVIATTQFGIFLYTDGATLKNIHIGQGSITSSSSMGGIVLSGASTDFTNCSNAATLIANNQVGGICYTLSGTSTIDHCWNSGAITGGGAAGAICGTAASGTTGNVVIQNCYNEGSISSTSAVGGIVGNLNVAKVIACYNTGTLTGLGKNINVGGIAGVYQGHATNGAGYITACYNTGTVTSSSNRESGGKIYLGGITGLTNNGYVVMTASYNAGTVSWTGTGDEGNLYLGGIGGYQGETITSGSLVKAAEITACYWKTEGNPANGIGARRDQDNQVEASAPASDIGTTKFADEWPTNSVHTDWGTTYWKTISNGVYPKLAWEQ
jgi:hypothetical protein